MFLSDITIISSMLFAKIFFFAIKYPKYDSNKNDYYSYYSDKNVKNSVEIIRSASCVTAMKFTKFGLTFTINITIVSQIFITLTNNFISALIITAAWRKASLIKVSYIISQWCETCIRYFIIFTVLICVTFLNTLVLICTLVINTTSWKAFIFIIACIAIIFKSLQTHKPKLAISLATAWVVAYAIKIFRATRANLSLKTSWWCKMKNWWWIIIFW